MPLPTEQQYNQFLKDKLKIDPPPPPPERERWGISIIAGLIVYILLFWSKQG